MFIPDASITQKLHEDFKKRYTEEDWKEYEEPYGTNEEEEAILMEALKDWVRNQAIV